MFCESIYIIFSKPNKGILLKKYHLVKHFMGPYGFIRSSKLPSALRSRCLFPVLCALREATRKASASFCLVWKCFQEPNWSWYSISTLTPPDPPSLGAELGSVGHRMRQPSGDRCFLVGKGHRQRHRPPSLPVSRSPRSLGIVAV